MAADLKHRLGIPYRKIAELFQMAFGLEVTASGLCQADERLAEKAEPVYQELVEAVRDSVAVYADETGWRIGVLSAWLWVFTSQTITVYTIDERRSHLDRPTFEVRLKLLEAQLDALMAEGRRFTDPDNARLARRLRKQRPNLLRFLQVEGVEATNNRAERALRAAVIVRKTGGCNKTLRGARTHAVLVSVLQTLKQQGREVVNRHLSFESRS